MLMSGTRPFRDWTLRERRGEQLLVACAQIGRDPGEVRWSAQVQFDGTAAEKLIDDLRQWWQAGFSELVIDCRGPDPAEAARVVAQTVLPQLRRWE